MLSPKKTWLVLSAIFFISFVLIGCAEDKQINKKPNRQHLVEVVQVELETLSIERERTATLQSNQVIEIFNQEEGQIVELPFFEGDKIDKGDVVAQLDDRLLRSQLAKTKALRRKAEKDLKRISGLANKQMTALAELNRVETELAVAKADEQTLLTRLDYATIRAPISGVVSQRLTEVGNIAQRYSHLLTISDQSSLTTEVTVSELIINKLSVGSPVDIQIDALFQNQPIKGKIGRIHPNLDPLTRTGIVEIQLKPIPDGARPGQLARVILRSEPEARLLIPYSALRRSSAGEFVFLVNDEQVVKQVKVQSGFRINDQVEILKGVGQGQQIVTRGFTNLQNDKKVSIVNRQLNVQEPEPADTSTAAFLPDTK